ncbi:hypothetical protein BGZ54_001234 [Gamsiella multidivaricata]|nr:hypothetical protein BGZ54_001234 [Gamsiella multidivaricata]
MAVAWFGSLVNESVPEYEWKGLQRPAAAEVAVLVPPAVDMTGVADDDDDDDDGGVGTPVETTTPGGRGVPGATTGEGAFVQTVVLVFLISPSSPPDSYETSENGKRTDELRFQDEILLTPKSTEFREPLLQLLLLGLWSLMSLLPVSLLLARAASGLPDHRDVVKMRCDFEGVALVDKVLRVCRGEC